MLHPVLQYLPSKLAEWIGENMQDELGFPDKRDPNKWSISELNNILQTYVVSDRNGLGCGSLGGANLAWGASQWLRLRNGASQ